MVVINDCRLDPRLSEEPAPFSATEVLPEEKERRELAPEITFGLVAEIARLIVHPFPTILNDPQNVIRTGKARCVPKLEISKSTHC
jgi:hypothetical protein